MEQISSSRPIPCLAGLPLTTKPILISVPGSKSITNRALLLATLANGSCTLRGALFSEDSRHFLKCIQTLGFQTVVDEANCSITVEGFGGKPPLETASLFVGSAGTAARFLTAYLGVSKGTWHLDASEQMRRRPMGPLLQALESLGCEISYEGQPGCFPFTLTGHGFLQPKVTVDIDHSSQFLSALLIASCLSDIQVDIEVTGSHGMSYIAMTRQMMEQFGVKTFVREASPPQNPSCIFTTLSGQSYRAMDYLIEPDVSAACYFYGMAALLGVSVTVHHVLSDSLQGDIHFLNLLTQMGCSRTETPDGICITGPADGHLRGIHADMSACSDQAITLAALAPFADAPTIITGIGHIRYQESDRIHAICTELTKMGIRCEEEEDQIIIYPGSPSPCTVDTYEDHRIAMGFSLIGLRAPGIVIHNPDCCRKTFENYFDVLDTFIAECCHK